MVLETKRYVIITPARDEEAYVERTIESILSQTILPLKWVIVDDGSTDSTAKIAYSYSKRFDFIEPVRLSHDRSHDFSSKVYAIREGYKYLQDSEYYFIGNLDADISLAPDYYQRILGEFEKDDKLGIAGGIVAELVDNQYVNQKMSLNSVAGAIQLFRRQCYEDIGGYMPLQHGGIDAAAEIVARMKGWNVKTFPEIRVLHHRRVATGRHNAFSTKFYQGVSNYSLGYHPLFHVASAIFRITEKPFLLGSISLISGYFWAFIRNHQKKMPIDVEKYLRVEQIGRLKSTLFFRSKL